MGQGVWPQLVALGQRYLGWGIVALAGVLVLASGLAAFGVVGWLPLAADGVVLQLVVTLVVVMLLGALPAQRRLMQLEAGQRSFQVGMEDVRRAYMLAHAEDRRGVFALSSEFEAMRERMQFLRRHPDLQLLEPELLELAAQMSFEARELARVYSDERLGRARDFLKGRQREAELMADRIRLARMVCDELRGFLNDVETEERTNHAQIARLEADLREILPALGYDFDEAAAQGSNVVSLPKGHGRGEGAH